MEQYSVISNLTYWLLTKSFCGETREIRSFAILPDKENNSHVPCGDGRCMVRWDKWHPLSIQYKKLFTIPVPMVYWESQIKTHRSYAPISTTILRWLHSPRRRKQRPINSWYIFMEYSRIFLRCLPMGSLQQMLTCHLTLESVNESQRD